MKAVPVLPFAAPTDNTAASPRTLRRGQRVAFIVGLFLLSRLLVFATAQVTWDHFPKAPQPPNAPLAHGSLVELFHRADATQYAELIDHGYHYEADPAGKWAMGNVGFYPVFPLLTRAMKLLVPDTLLAGQIVSNLLLLVACFLLWELALLELRSATAAAWTVAFLLFCPGAAWFSMVFSESAFLVLLLAFIWVCRRQRWRLAAGAGFLLPLTRAIGVVAVVFAALEVWTDWRTRRRAGAPLFSLAAGDAARALAVAAPVLGYLAFFVFLRVRFGDWHAQHKAMLTMWPANAYLATPWGAIARDWAMMHQGKRVVIYGLLTAGLTLSALGYPALRRWSYPALAFALIGMVVIATSHAPMARYLSVVVPLHLTLAWLAGRSRPLGWALLAASATMMLGLTAALVNGFNFY